MRLFLSRYGVLIAFLIATAGTVGSLFYSEVLGYAPCILCWYQRALLYPQIVLLALAQWRGMRNLINFCIALSLAGATVAGYNYLIQEGFMASAPCAASAVSCQLRYVAYFGFITIPLMSLAAFLIIAAVLYANKNLHLRK